jgi:hypothetical protein
MRASRMPAKTITGIKNAATRTMRNVCVEKARLDGRAVSTGT